MFILLVNVMKLNYIKNTSRMLKLVKLTDITSLFTPVQRLPLVQTYKTNHLSGTNHSTACIAPSSPATTDRDFTKKLTNLLSLYFVRLRGPRACASNE